MDRLSEWQSYMPQYRFPNFLRWSCGCLGVSLVGFGLFIFLVLPGLISYMLSLESPTFEVEMGSTVNLDAYGLTFVRVERDTRCEGDPLCTAPGRVVLVFSTTLNADEYDVTYVDGTDFSESVGLPQGYLFRIIGISPPRLNPEGRYIAELEIFDPPPS